MRGIDVNFTRSPEHIERKGGHGGPKPYIQNVNVVNVRAIVLLIKELEDAREHLHSMLKTSQLVISVPAQGEFQWR
jgi:hypothetical protein